MKEISEWQDIIIPKADKGGAVVIVDVKGYIKEAEQQLNNTENYWKLQEDPRATNMKLVSDTIERFKKKKNNKWKSCRRPKKKWHKNTKILYATEDT